MGYTVELRVPWADAADGGNDARSHFEYRLANAADGLGHSWSDDGDRFLLKVAGGHSLFGRHGQEDAVLPLYADDLGIHDVTLPFAALCVDEVVVGPLGPVTRIGCGARGEAGRWRLLHFPNGYAGPDVLRPGMWIESGAGDSFQLDYCDLEGNWQALLHGAITPDAIGSALPPTRTTPPAWLCEEAQDAREGYDLAKRGQPQMSQDFRVLLTAAYVVQNGRSYADFLELMERQVGPKGNNNYRLPRMSGSGGLGYYIGHIGSKGQRLGELDRPAPGLFYGRAHVKDWEVLGQVAHSLYVLGFLRDADFDGLPA